MPALGEAQAQENASQKKGKTEFPCAVKACFTRSSFLRISVSWWGLSPLGGTSVLPYGLNTLIRWKFSPLRPTSSFLTGDRSMRFQMSRGLQLVLLTAYRTFPPAPQTHDGRPPGPCCSSSSSQSPVHSSPGPQVAQCKLSASSPSVFPSPLSRQALVTLSLQVPSKLSLQVSCPYSPPPQLCPPSDHCHLFSELLEHLQQVLFALDPSLSSTWLFWRSSLKISSSLTASLLQNLQKLSTAIKSRILLNVP